MDLLHHQRPYSTTSRKSTKVLQHPASAGLQYLHKPRRNYVQNDRQGREAKSYTNKGVDHLNCK